jgi:hypothetical protein
MGGGTVKFSRVFVVVFVLSASTLSAADKPDWNGYWWAGMTPRFKLGWVSGYAKAMDNAAAIHIATCVANMPLYQEKFPNLDPKALLQKMCLSDNSLDYDGISMGQFVDGIDAFYNDYRNKQLEVGWAIEYVRDQIKGKSSQELEAEVTAWRRCTAAYQSGDTEQIKEGCKASSATQ